MNYGFMYRVEITETFSYGKTERTHLVTMIGITRRQFVHHHGPSVSLSKATVLVTIQGCHLLTIYYDH